MKNDAQILQEEFEKLKRDLIARHYDLGMPASGQWMDSLENRTERLSGQLWGENYTEMLTDGRRPGKFPPVKAIEQWILDKNLKIEGKIKVSSLAFLIARKIAKEGTKYHKTKPNFVDEVITPERIQSILDKVSEFHINNFVFEFRGVFKKMAST